MEHFSQGVILVWHLVDGLINTESDSKKKTLVNTLQNYK